MLLTPAASQILETLLDGDSCRDIELRSVMFAYDLADKKPTADGFWDFMDTLDVTDLDRLVAQCVADDIVDGIDEGWPCPSSVDEWRELATYCGATGRRVDEAVRLAKDEVGCA